MDIEKNWREIKTIVNSGIRSSFHCAIASVDESGNPHITPIGSLTLTQPGQGFFCEVFTTQLPQNLSKNKQLCVLVVNSEKWFWLKSLLLGHFPRFPALRLKGLASEPRDATANEQAHLSKSVSAVSFTKGHKIMWRAMNRVRDIEFTSVEPVRLGGMTQNL